MFAQFMISDQPMGRTPVRFGVNIETQPDAETSNLWDWLKDSGAQILREFHPEKRLRDPAALTVRWDACVDRESFDQFRADILRNPESAIPWDTYYFEREVPWLGVPDRIVKRVHEIGAEAVCSLGWCPKMYSESLVVNLESGAAFDPDSDAGIDWRAAASAWEYYFAEVFFFARRHGVTRFSMYNEPEWSDHFHFPDDPDLLEKKRDAVVGKNLDLYPKVAAIIAAQVAAMCRLARMAMKDVSEFLAPERGETIALQLIGPTSAHLWKEIWSKAEPYLDTCNYHVYAVDPAIHETIHRCVEQVVQPSDKRIAITEFNLKGGPMLPENTFFSWPRAIELARLLQRQLTLPAVKGPVMDFTTLYLFAFPATHRNYKALVYGDMNLVDWSVGGDVALRDRGTDWYPQFDELQLRFATPAYHLYRMMARCTPGAVGCDQPFPVYPCVAPILYGSDNGEFDQIEAIAIDQGDRVMINFISLRALASGDILLDMSPYSERFRMAIVRRTCSLQRDALLDVVDLSANHRVTLQLPGLSLTQLVLLPFDPGQAETLEIREETYTPGGLKAGLEKYQTTRLRAYGLFDGEWRDLSECAVRWRSSQPDNVPVSQSGLVIRLRPSTGAVQLSAGIPGSQLSAAVELCHK